MEVRPSGAALSAQVGPGEEIWELCILVEPGCPGKPCLTLKGESNTTAGPGNKWEELRLWDEEGN